MCRGRVVVTQFGGASSADLGASSNYLDETSKGRSGTGFRMKRLAIRVSRS